jgi:hypothetical protein
LPPALRIRRRQLDSLRLAISAEQARAASITMESADLGASRTAERLRAANSEVPSDAWFVASAKRLADLGRLQTESEQRLAALRQSAAEARARLSLLEQADEAALAAKRRARDKAAQAALDDRTAAMWNRP